MAIRPAANVPLGVPQFEAAHDSDMGFPLGTIIGGYDSTNNRTNEYIWLRSVANIAVGDDVTYNSAYLVTEVGAGTGQADAIVASGVNQYAWFQLKPR